MDPFNVQAKMDPADPTKIDISFNTPLALQNCLKAKKYIELSGFPNSHSLLLNESNIIDRACLQCSWNDRICPVPKIKIQSTSGKIYPTDRRIGMLW